jgi:hypothetical protein
LSKRSIYIPAPMLVIEKTTKRTRTRTDQSATARVRAQGADRGT